MTDEIMRYLEKAEHALLVAADLFDDGHLPDAASKIYYAMFYATKALLASDGIQVVKHSAVEPLLLNISHVMSVITLFKK